MVSATVLSLADDSEHLLLGEPGRAVRLEIISGTLLNGPVLLSYRLSGVQQVRWRLAALQRFIGCQSGNVASGTRPRSSSGARRLQVLRTLDALALDPRHRAVSIALFGAPQTQSDWRQGSDYLKSRVRRLVAQARSLADGGYRNLVMLGRE